MGAQRNLGGFASPPAGPYIKQINLPANGRLQRPNNLLARIIGHITIGQFSGQ